MTAISVDEAAGQTGLGSMLADLLRQNLEHYPERHAQLARMRGVVDIVASDATTTARIEFLEGGLRVCTDGGGRPDLRIVTDSVGLLELTAARLRAGLPDPAHASGRRVLRQVLHGRLKIRGWGLLLKPTLLPRLNRLINVAVS